MKFKPFHTQFHWKKTQGSKANLIQNMTIIVHHHVVYLLALSKHQDQPYLSPAVKIYTFTVCGGVILCLSNLAHLNI